MRNKLLAVLLFIEVIIFVVVGNKSTGKISYKHTIDAFIKNDINESKLENYIIGVVAAEMPASFSFEALKSQAVVARTFAYKKISDNTLSYDLLKEDKGQSYISIDEMKQKWKNDFEKNYKIIQDAVLSTKGEIISYNNEPISAYYFSMSNGITEDSKTVFNEEPYLSSVDSSWDKNEANYEKTVSLDINDFKNKLKLNCENITIENINRSSTNHVDKITVCNNEFDGVNFRKLLNLRSTDFDISISDNVQITTRGYGHGVGMSQYGANHLALDGKTYKDIINYYYKNVTIKKHSIF